MLVRDFNLKMNSFYNWLFNVLESMANAFIHPIKNNVPPPIGMHSYSTIPVKRRFRKKYN